MPRARTPNTDRPLVPPPRKPHERTLRLQCPECTETIAVPRRALVEGGVVHCGHCGSEPELTQEFDDATGKTRWTLVDALADYDEDVPAR